eukprot:GDKJ01029714.1.p2 GENE.GDKJ01029714.1~~GDKJ01029714.1.p2  ORF type:complete len:109 (-),score=6.42 GDKJ01029714.1:224-511(-)
MNNKLLKKNEFTQFEWRVRSCRNAGQKAPASSASSVDCDKKTTAKYSGTKRIHLLNRRQKYQVKADRMRTGQDANFFLAMVTGSLRVVFSSARSW